MRAFLLRVLFCRRGEHHIDRIPNGRATVSYCLVPGCPYTEPWPWWS